MPSRTGQTVVYVFDDVDTFPVLDSETTARSSVTARVEGQDPEACLRVAWKRGHDDPPVVNVVLALPPVAVAGEPDGLFLTVSGDASGCSLSLKVADGRGRELLYPLGRIDFTGQRTLSIKVREPGESRRQQHQEVTPAAVPPLQPFELWLTMTESCRSVGILIRTLSVTGNVRLAPPGLASRDQRQA